MSSILIHYGDSKSEYFFKEGCNLLDFLRSLGFSISAPCGGNGLCGKCTVLYKTADKIKEVIACKTLLNENCEVFLQKESSQISWNSSNECFTPEKSKDGVGAIVDLGTSTVAVCIYSLRTGQLIDSLSRWNIQKSYGADVISRIGYCMESEISLFHLSNIIRSQILEMIEFLCDKNDLTKTEIKDAFLAGNTVMEHIFAGIDPSSIGKAPYLPMSYFDSNEIYRNGNINFSIAPCVSGFVGGDITTGLLSELIDKSKTFIFIDIGTNGEIVLHKDDSYFTCAVASGPAFEGAGISCGMPAVSGAVSKAELCDEGIIYDVIGGGEAKGICGSGLLDIISCLLELEIIDESGFMEFEDERDAFYITDKVFVNQQDIRRFQLAKAAVCAGIMRIMDLKNTAYSDIDVIYISGGYGNGLNCKNAIITGMLPKEFEGKIETIGNTCLQGAAQALLSLSKREELNKIKQKCEYIELSADSGFNDKFVESMAFSEQ